MSERKWAHAASASSSKGKTKLYCSCGWQTKPVPYDVSSELQQEHVRHTGLIERMPKQVT